MKHTAKNAGFTLVEVLVTMGLMAVFMITITDVVVAVGDVQTSSESTSDVTEDGRFMLARLSYDIQRATSISTPATLGGTSSSLALVIGGNTQTYSVSGGNLQLVNNLGADNLNGANTSVSGLSFTRRGNSGGNETITLSFTVTSKVVAHSNTETKTYTTTVERR